MLLEWMGRTGAQYMIAPTVILKCAEKKLKFMVVEKENSGEQEIIFRVGTGLWVCLPGNGGHQGS